MDAYILVLGALGALVFALPFPGEPPLFQNYPQLTEPVTEFVVIIALMGAGLKLDMPLTWAKGQLTWRLRYRAPMNANCSSRPTLFLPRPLVV